MFTVYRYFSDLAIIVTKRKTLFKLSALFSIALYVIYTLEEIAKHNNVNKKRNKLLVTRHY